MARRGEEEMASMYRAHHKKQILALQQSLHALGLRLVLSRSGRQYVAWLYDDGYSRSPLGLGRDPSKTRAVAVALKDAVQSMGKKKVAGLLDKEQLEDLELALRLA